MHDFCHSLLQHTRGVEKPFLVPMRGAFLLLTTPACMHGSYPISIFTPNRYTYRHWKDILLFPSVPRPQRVFLFWSTGLGESREHKKLRSIAGLELFEKGGAIRHAGCKRDDGGHTAATPGPRPPVFGS